MKLNKPEELNDGIAGAPPGLTNGAPFATTNGDMKSASTGSLTEKPKKKKKAKK